MLMFILHHACWYKLLYFQIRINITDLCIHEDFIDVLKIYDGNSSLSEELDAHGAICPDDISDIPSVISAQPNVYVRFGSGSEDTARGFRLEFNSESMHNIMSIR